MNSDLFGVHALVAPVSNVNVTEDEVKTLDKDTLLLFILAIHPQIYQSAMAKYEVKYYDLSISMYNIIHGTYKIIVRTCI